MRTKHVLIAVTGMTPQVVTETLYALMVQRKIPVKEVFIITTAEGKEALAGSPTRNIPALRDELVRMCTLFSLTLPLFDPSTNVLVAQEESIELYDIRTDKDNQLFPNMISEIVRQKAAIPGTILHCCITGGRKTMSVALAQALSLFGRKDDKLYHVLVSKSFEESRKFFPETPTEQNELVLAEVPYIRLREKLPLLLSHSSLLLSLLFSPGRAPVLRLAVQWGRILSFSPPCRSLRSRVFPSSPPLVLAVVALVLSPLCLPFWLLLVPVLPSPGGLVAGSLFRSGCGLRVALLRWFVSLLRLVLPLLCASFRPASLVALFSLAASLLVSAFPSSFSASASLPPVCPGSVVARGLRFGWRVMLRFSGSPARHLSGGPSH